MRLFHILAYDNTIQGTDAIYTSDLIAQQLASADQLRFFAVTEDVSGTSPTLTVQTEESSDGWHWDNLFSTAEINGDALSTSGTTVAKGTDSGSRGTLGLVRLRIQLGGTSPAARVRLWVTGRGSPIR